MIYSDSIVLAINIKLSKSAWQTLKTLANCMGPILSVHACQTAGLRWTAGGLDQWHPVALYACESCQGRGHMSPSRHQTLCLDILCLRVIMSYKYRGFNTIHPIVPV